MDVNTKRKKMCAYPFFSQFYLAITAKICYNNGISVSYETILVI